MNDDDNDHLPRMAKAGNPDGPLTATTIESHPTGGPIHLTTAQRDAAKTWAADDRLWTTQETVELNLLTFARVVLSGLPSDSATGDAVTPPSSNHRSAAVAGKISDDPLTGTGEAEGYGHGV